MRKIWYIFKRDLKAVFRNPVAAVIAVGIMILPSLYAWFNIAANWDPYGNTGELKVAVVNEDEGLNTESMDLPDTAKNLLESKDINIGNMVENNLKMNDQIGWQFVSKDEAMDGVSDGTYYAAVVIPSDFSSDIASILSENVNHPEIEYYVNEKKNAIATKITDKGVGTIQQQVNESFISAVSEALSSVLNLTGEGIDSLKETVGNNAVSILSNIQNDTEQVSNSLKAIESLLRAMQQVGDTASSVLPDFEEVFDDSQIKITDLMSAIDSAHSLSKRTLDQMDEILYSTGDLADSAKKAADFAFSVADEDSETVKAALQKAIDINQRLLRMQESILNALKQLDTYLPGDTHLVLGNMISKVSSQIDRTNSIIDKLSDAKSDISKGIKITDGLMQDVYSLYDTLESAQNELEQYYRNSVKSSLQTALDDVYDVLITASSRISALESSIPETKTSLENMDEAYTNLIDVVSQLNSSVDQLKIRLQEIHDEADKLAKGGNIDQLINIINTDPQAISDFMASPVTLTTHKLYPIVNYGSAMTPFYTVLCLWVGGLVLVAILKCDVKDDEVISDAKPYQRYFGRYFTFLLFALAQAVIVAMGDLFILKIQCLHPWLFVLAAMYTSFVFSLFIYTLTISFGDVGKAVAVVFLVIQVAGAGGTFPIEVTPMFFRILNPLMPFTHMINAMRECVGGLYGNAYWMDILKVSAYIPVSLLIGIVLRIPIIHIKHFFEEKLEETGLM